MEQGEDVGGKAYAFFDCSASKQELQAALPKIRECVKTPSQLELLLSEVKELDAARTDPDLLQFIHDNEIYATYPSNCKHLMKDAKPVRMDNLRYVLEATHPQAKIDATGDALANVMDQLYQCYGENKPFNVAIAAKVGGRYVFYD